MNSFSIANWNLGGGKFLKLDQKKRLEMQKRTGEELERYCCEWQPDVICLQEVTAYRQPGKKHHQFVSPPDGYNYCMIPVVDTARHSHPVRWSRYKDAGNWAEDDYIGQGLGFLWKKELLHSSLWEFNTQIATESLRYEEVPFGTGLFTGDRDSEPRSAVIGHFIVTNQQQITWDVFVVNLHLTTFVGEREDKPEVDQLGATTRCQQVQTVLHGIVSRHIVWSHFLRSEKDQRRQLWLIAGDFNAGPHSGEISMIHENGFFDATPVKASGNKAHGQGKAPSHTVDYIFANYIFWDDIRQRFEVASRDNPAPDLSYTVSDHYPIIARIPI